MDRERHFAESAKAISRAGCDIDHSGGLADFSRRGNFCINAIPLRIDSARDFGVGRSWLDANGFDPEMTLARARHKQRITKVLP
jgi:hypothetical protein